MTFVRNSLIRDLFNLKRINHFLYRQKRSFSITLSCRNHQYDTPVDDIRNFCIIAHIDHGKSTLADRLLEVTGAISKTVDNQQILDNLQVERERGITVKAQTVSIYYEFKKNGKVYLLNLIDTPGHVDFSSEVTRSLSICDGCVLLVDATHGVQAQTVANFHLAKSNGLIIIPVINKIDMKHANPEKVAQELGVLFGIDASEILKISAKLGHGVEDVLEAIIAKIPSPANINRDGRFRALVFDSWYDRYRGALNLVYVHDGQLNMGQEVQSIATKKIYPVRSISLIRPDEFAIDSIKAGQIGLIGCNMRNSKESVIGDTLRIKNDNEIIPLDIIKQSHQPIVFAGIYPTDQSKYVNLQSAIDKLSLNDSSVSIANDSSPALSYGWRIGFLGLLHMEVFCQRLEQEYDADLIITAPSVTYNITLINQKLIKLNGGRNSLTISNPAAFPNAVDIGECFEPCIIGTIITPVDYMGQIISLCIERRGVQRKSMNLDNDRILMEYVLPLNEIIVDFNDKLKSLSSGYASFNYEDNGYRLTNIAKLDILLNGKKIDELCRIVHVSKATLIAREMVFKLKEEIPRQMVQIAIQACVGSKILARETIKAFRKDVTAKLYGGDVTRRMKLLRQQAEGKKKMRSIANIRIPHETFINVLKR